MLKGLLKKEIHSLYLNNLLRGIAFSLFGIFIPIYFLTLGYSLMQVFVYFLVFQTTLFLSLLISYKFSRTFGYKNSILLNAPLTIIFLLLLFFLESTNISINLLALIAGIKSGFFYIPMHSYFARLSEKNKKGTQLSTMIIFGQIAGLFGPLIGAGIATFFGFKYLFPIVLFFILLSIIPLLKLDNYGPKKKVKTKDLIEFSRNHKGFFYGTILDNIEGEIEGHIWPIFVFLIITSLFSVGGVAFLITFGSIIFSALIGRHYDKKSKYLFLRIGGIIFAAVWIARAFIDLPAFIYISSLVAGFLSLMVSIPFESIFYEKASKDTDQDSFIIYREFPSFIGRAIAWMAAILLIGNFKVIFIFAGAAYLLLSFLKFGVYKKNGK